MLFEKSKINLKYIVRFKFFFVCLTNFSIYLGFLSLLFSHKKCYTDLWRQTYSTSSLGIPWSLPFYGPKIIQRDNKFISGDAENVYTILGVVSPVANENKLLWIHINIGILFGICWLRYITNLLLIEADSYASIWYCFGSYERLSLLVNFNTKKMAYFITRLKTDYNGVTFWSFQSSTSPCRWGSR